MISKISLYTTYVPAVIPPEENGGEAWWFVFSDGKLLVNVQEDKATIPCIRGLDELNLHPDCEHYLGTLGGRHCYTAAVGRGVVPLEGMTFEDLRSMFGLLDEDIFLLAGRASQIVHWDQTHQYCGRCGTKTRTKDDERAKVCPACGFMSYPRISPAVIGAVVKGNEILLAHAKHFRGNMYSVIAGYVEPGETLEEAFKREVMEEVGIRIKNIQYFGSQPWPFPDSLMLGFIAEYESGEIEADGIEISDAGWFRSSNLPEIPSKLSIARKLIDWFVKNHP